METNRDFSELFASLNAHDVAYIVVGAYALAFHGAPRYTGDIDVYVQPTPENAGRLLAALKDFGFGSLGLSVDDFTRPDHVVQLGVPPLRVDLLTAIEGVTWAEADQGKVAGSYGDVPVHYLGRDQYVMNKRAAGRQKDLADLDALDRM